jgi:hypothetical protein
LTHCRFFAIIDLSERTERRQGKIVDSRERDPIWLIFRHRHLQYVWLAERTGYSLQYIREVASGHKRPSATFRAKCAFAMDLPEHLLFRESSGASATSGATSEALSA